MVAFQIQVISTPSKYSFSSLTPDPRGLPLSPLGRVFMFPLPCLMVTGFQFLRDYKAKLGRSLEFYSGIKESLTFSCLRELAGEHTPPSFLKMQFSQMTKSCF